MEDRATGKETVNIKAREGFRSPEWAARQISEIYEAITNTFRENTNASNGPYFEIELQSPTPSLLSDDLIILLTLELYEPTQTPDPGAPAGLRIMVNRYDAKILRTLSRATEVSNAMDIANVVNRGAQEMWRRLIGQEEDRRVQARRAYSAGSAAGERDLRQQAAVASYDSFLRPALGSQQVNGGAYAAQRGLAAKIIERDKAKADWGRKEQEAFIAIQEKLNSIFNNMLDGGIGRNYNQFFDGPPSPTTTRVGSVQPQYYETMVASLWDPAAVGLRGEPATVVEKLVEVIGTRKRKIVLED